MSIDRVGRVVELVVRHFVLKYFQNALEELLKGLFLVLHGVDKVLEFVYIGLQPINAYFLHLYSIFCIFLVLVYMNTRHFYSLSV